MSNASLYDNVPDDPIDELSAMSKSTGDVSERRPNKLPQPLVLSHKKTNSYEPAMVSEERLFKECENRCLIVDDGTRQTSETTTANTPTCGDSCVCVINAQK